MIRRVLCFMVLAVAVAVVPITVAGQAQNARTSAAAASDVPKTPWGHPDLQGTWDYRTITPLERPREFGTREFYTDEEVKTLEERARKRMDEPPPDDAPAGTVHPAYWTDPGRRVSDSRRTSLIVDPPDGRLPPLTPEAAARGATGGGRAGGTRPGGRADSWLDRSLLERCIVQGLPTSNLPTLYNNNIQLVQSPGAVVIVHEMVHDARVIPLDGSAPLSPGVTQWLGSSRGRWEGDTLVVETTNFSEKSSYRGAPTAGMRLVERYRRVDADTLELRLTVDNPSTWTKPWTALLNLRPSEGELVEYACHEGNYGLRNILEVARDEEKAAAAAAAAQQAR